jgi:hypothetical protein
MKSKRLTWKEVTFIIIVEIFFINLPVIIFEIVPELKDLCEKHSIFF